jgi:hypothetical protein
MLAAVRYNWYYIDIKYTDIKFTLSLVGMQLPEWI